MDNPDALIPDGVTCEMVVTTEPVEAAAVPRSALVFSDDGVLGVRIADDEDRARFMPISIVDDGRESVWVTGHRQADPGDRRRPGFRQGRRPGRGGVRPIARGGAAGMRRIVEFAIDHARLTIAILIFLLVAGRQRLHQHSQGSRAGRHDSDHLRPALAGRHFAGGCRAAARPADGDRSSRRSPTSRR